MSRVVPLSILFLFVSFAANGAVGEAGTATDSLRETYAQANQIISDPATIARPSELMPAVRALFSTAFDFQGAAAEALGPEWRTLTAPQQKEFTALFATFVQRGFVYWLASVADVDGTGITVYYLGESVEGDRAVVRTAIGRRGGRQVPLDHDMIYLGKRWMVRDVTLNGVSLVPNYRAQFDRVIRGSSYPALLARLRGKVAGEIPKPAAARPELPSVLKLPALETR